MKFFTFIAIMSLGTFAFSQDSFEKIRGIECVGKLHSRIVDENAEPIYVAVTIKDYKESYENEISYASRLVIGDPLNLYGNMQGGMEEPAADRENGLVVYEMFPSEELADAPFVERFKQSVASLSVRNKFVDGKLSFFEAFLDYIDQRESSVTASYEGLLDCKQN